MKNIPNIITIIRLLLVPVFSYYLLKDQDLVAGIIFIVASLSDVLDGYLARKLKAVSNFGKLADPFADKIMQIVAIIILVVLGRLNVWIMVLLFVKDFILMLGGLLMLLIFKLTVFSRWFGKASAVLLNALIAASIIFSLNPQVINVLMIIAMVTQMLTLIAYAVIAIKEIRLTKNKEITS